MVKPEAACAAAAQNSESDAASRFRLALSGALACSLVLFLDIFSHVGELGEFTSAWTVSQVSRLVACLLFLGYCLSFPREDDQSFQGRPVDRQQTCSLLELATFSWPRKVFGLKGIQRATLKELPALRSGLRARYLNKRCNVVDTKRLSFDLAKSHFGALLLQWTLAIASSFVVLVPQLIIYRLLQWLDTHEKGDGLIAQGLGLAILLGAAEFVDVLLDSWLSWVTASKIQYPIQAALNTMVYQKAMRLPDPANVDGTHDKGKLSGRWTLSQLRMSSAQACVLYIETHHILMTVGRLVWTTTLLIKMLDWKSLAVGLLASALVMPLTTILSKKLAISRTEKTKIHQQHSAVLTDALLAIRQIKLTSAEETWKCRIHQLRAAELKQVLTGAVWSSTLTFVASLSPVVLSSLPLYIFTLQGHQLNPSIAFTSITLFRQLLSNISHLPMLMPHIWEALFNFDRLEDFFRWEELDASHIIPSTSVSLNEATVTWYGKESDEDRFTLHCHDVQFPDRALSLVTGKTGSGKSLLLLALAGEAKLLSGSIHRPCLASGIDDKFVSIKDWVVQGQIALVTQSPWMANTTIRENILFGLPMEKDRYDRVLYSCAIKKDLDTLEEGDATIVGIRGATLSGGQRWRVALARALYSRASLLLLDDVLSAVDAEVRDWIVEKALLGDLATGRTRILATHHVSQCLKGAAYHVDLDDGTAKVQEGPFSFPERQSRRPAEQLRTDKAINSQDAASEDNGRSSKEQQKQVTSQFITPKSAHLSPYKIYFDASGGRPSWLLALLATAVYEAVGLATSRWLRDFSSQRSKGTFSNSNGSAYILMTALSCVITAVRSFVWYAIGLKASRNLSTSMTGAIFGSPLQWLEKTSHGEILTRFSSDMSKVDGGLPHDIGYLIEGLSRLGVILYTCASLSIYEMCLFSVLLYMYVTVGKRLTSVMSYVKTLRSTAASSLQQHFNSLLAPDGISTVRAYGPDGYFTNRMYELIDDNTSSIWHLTLCRIVMDFQLGILGAVFVTSSALSVVFAGVDAGTAGIVLSFSMQFSSTVAGLLQRIANFQFGLNSVSMIAEYGNIRQESTAGVEVPEAWLSNGDIQVQGLSAGYGIDLPAALDDVSFCIKPGERVGVVGRTGAGKSSLALALARLIEIRKGSIVIDGIDISTVKLDVLRRQILIIPQDPYLFAGSLRDMLDPERAYDNSTLIALLKTFRLDPSISSSSSSFPNLSFMIEHGGSNISQGQRQILYLAKAVLSRKKIIVMDEATSAVDAETERAIQAFLKDGGGLHGATVLVIAHRLSTVASLDRVLVLEDGRAVEFGTPRELYERKGQFWKLVAHSPESMADMIIDR